MSGNYIVNLNGKYVSRDTAVALKTETFDKQTSRITQRTQVVDKITVDADKAKARWFTRKEANEVAERLRLRYRAFDPYIDVEEVLTPREIAERIAAEEAWSQHAGGLVEQPA